MVLIQVKLIDKNGKVLFERPNVEFRERYEISVNPKQYFDESQVAVQRLARCGPHRRQRHSRSF